MKKNSAKMLICAGLCTVAICGTGVISYAETLSVSALEGSLEGGMKMPQEDGSLMAKITAVGDGTLTVTIAQKPERKSGDGTDRMEDGSAGGRTLPERLDDGETPPEKPADGETPPEKPANGETPPERPESGETPPAAVQGENSSDGQGKKNMMNFSSDETTVYLTDSTSVTKGKEKEDGSVSELAAGDIVRLVLEDTQVISIDIME